MIPQPKNDTALGQVEEDTAVMRRCVWAMVMGQTPLEVEDMGGWACAWSLSGVGRGRRA